MTLLRADSQLAAYVGAIKLLRLEENIWVTSHVFAGGGRNSQHVFSGNKTTELVAEIKAAGFVYEPLSEEQAVSAAQRDISYLIFKRPGMSFEPSSPDGD